MAISTAEKMPMLMPTEVRFTLYSRMIRLHFNISELG